MSVAEKRLMFENHVISYFLNIYLRLLTDIDFKEQTFLVNNTISQRKADNQDRQRFLELMLKRVKQIAGSTITLDQLRKTNKQMDALLDKLENKDESRGVTEKVEASFKAISSQANIEIAETVVSFISSFSPDSLLTGANITATRLISPKVFERIFHLPVDLDDFEIDIEATQATESGRQMFNSAAFQKMIIKTGSGETRIKDRSSSSGGHILSELFINVESKFTANNSEIAPSTNSRLIRSKIEGSNK